MFKKLIGLMILAVIGSSCCTGVNNYYRSDWPPRQLARAIDSVSVIEMAARIKGQEEPRRQNGVCFSVGDGLVMALTHVITPNPLAVVAELPFMKFFTAVEFVSVEYLIDGQKAELIGSYGDVSLFAFDAAQPPPRFGVSEELKPGDRVLIIGHSLGRGFNIKDGVVSQTAIEEVSELIDTGRPMMVTAAINPGDSGAPVYACHHGRLELVGVAQATLTAGHDMGIVMSVDYLREAIVAIKAANAKP